MKKFALTPCITSRTVTGPGLKSRPPMATYCEPSKRAIARARANADTQRQQREAREYALTLSALEQNRTPPVETFPVAPEMPAKLALHQEQQPDPEFSQRYLSLLIGFALGVGSAILFEAGRP